MPADVASLTVRSERGGPLFHIRQFLNAFDVAYNYILLAEQFIVYPAEARARVIAQALEGQRRFGRMVPIADRVILKSVHLHSPGWWEFIGKLNPLEQSRLYLKDRHERLKERNYRERSEADRLFSENDMRAIEVLRAKIAVAGDGSNR